jgi:hypothetical protein
LALDETTSAIDNHDKSLGMLKIILSAENCLKVLLCSQDTTASSPRTAVVSGYYVSSEIHPLH